MPCKLNKKAYQQLIDEDVKWLESSTPDCLEQDHILQVLRHSISYYYPESEIDRLTAENKAQTEQIEKLEEALENISEYWNRSENDRAMNDALYHMIDVAKQALKGKNDEGNQCQTTVGQHDSQRPKDD